MSPMDKYNLHRFIYLFFTKNDFAHVLHILLIILISFKLQIA